MAVGTIARRYAIALADVAQSRNEVETIQAELHQWQALIHENRELSIALTNPVFKHAIKEKILETLIQKFSPSQTTANFLRVLLRNNRIAHLKEIAKSFSEVIEERNNVTLAKIVSARSLSEDEKEALRKSLEKKTGKKIRFELSTDPSLLGGIVATVGSIVFDGSVRNRLTILKERFIDNA